MSVLPFADALEAAVVRTRAPVVVGLDPRWEQLPDVLRQGLSDDWASRAQAYERFCCQVIDVVAPLVPAVKPQAAFFEQLGPDGMLALGRVMEHARRAGLLVILDAKRGDIGSTAEAYAAAYLLRGEARAASAHAPSSPWAADALTVNPYLGDDTLEPFVAACRAGQSGIFVLVKTSNPGSASLQDLARDGVPNYRHVARWVERLAESTRTQSAYGAVGAVVGATYPKQLVELRAAMPSAWILVPGFGAQGGTAADVAPAFDARGLGAVVNNSRGILFAHSRREYAGKFAPDQWQKAVESATREMIAQLRGDTRAGLLGQT